VGVVVGVSSKGGEQGSELCLPILRRGHVLSSFAMLCAVPLRHRRRPVAIHTGMVGGVPCGCVARGYLIVLNSCRMPALAFGLLLKPGSFHGPHVWPSNIHITHNHTSHSTRDTPPTPVPVRRGLGIMRYVEARGGHRGDCGLHAAASSCASEG
jgi:hypothetical protein